MKPALTAEIVWKDNDVVELRISASNDRFSGTANVYVGIGAPSQAAGDLAGFPHHVGDEREVVFGAFGANSAGGAVRIRFCTKGAAGHSFAAVSVESEHDNSGIAESTFFRSALDANAVDIFMRELRDLEEKKAGVAHLELRG